MPQGPHGANKLEKASLTQLVVQNARWLLCITNHNKRLES